MSKAPSGTQTPPDDDRTHPGAGGANRVIGSVVRRHWPALGGATVSTVLITLADLAQPWPLKFLIDNVVTGHSIPFSFSGSEVRMLVLIAAAVIGIALLDALATYTGDLWLKRARRATSSRGSPATPTRSARCSPTTSARWPRRC
jgi:ABC-type bacteriocin/lantibiotic exporter with double-glycine peptidase domain